MVMTLKEALIAVDAAADESWKAAVWASIQIIAGSQESFTTDDIWHYLEANFPDEYTEEPRALGPLMLRAVREGVAEIKTCSHCGTKKVVKESERSVNHKADLAVYRSLV